MEKVISRQLVRQTLSFEKPTRVPRQLWLLPWAVNHYPLEVQDIRQHYPDDIIAAPGFLRQTPVVHGDPYELGTYVDEWGCTFENRQRGVIGEVKRPLINNWDDMDRLRTPYEAFSVNKDLVNEFCRNTDRFVLGGCCPRPFERMQFLRSSVNVFLDLGYESHDFMHLLRQVHEYYLKELEVWATTDVDGLLFMDDWGAQRALLISPRQWRKIFKPLYKDYINLAHQSGKFIFMHSDGYIADIVPDLVELGLDALNSQLFVMDIEALGQRFAGKLTFWGEIDRQHILPANNKDLTREAVQRVKSALWKDGGCIAQCEFGAGARPENVRAVFETWDNIH